MGQMCSLCGRKPQIGNMIAMRGKAKRDGGVGKKTTGVTRRVFRPNLQKIRALVEGKAARIWACTRCIKSGKVTKPPRKWKVTV